MPSRSHLSRRQWLQDSLLLTAGTMLAHDWMHVLHAAESTGTLNRLPRTVHEYFVRRVREADEKNLAARRALKTKVDAERHVQDIRKKVAACFGPLPEKTPLNPKITGTVQREGYRIEKVIFESRPSFLVTANLYIPAQGNPRSGVVQVCGHSENGKAYPTYQAVCQGLVRKGFVVLVFDPIGQGERLQFPGTKNLSPA
ncbi:MAG: hypothetical protein U0903_18635 [Planctomycetales bacterium]